jgi:hypothetical protein
VGDPNNGATSLAGDIVRARSAHVNAAQRGGRSVHRAEPGACLHEDTSNVAIE